MIGCMPDDREVREREVAEGDLSATAVTDRDVSRASLAGRRIGVTADRRFDEQAALLGKRGAEVMHGPTLRTVDLSRDERLRRVTEDVVDRPPHYLVVTTAIGLRMWLEAAVGWGLDDRLKQVFARSVIVARGAKGASAVRGLGLPLAWRAPNETMDEVVAHLSSAGIENERVALQLFDPEGHPATEALRSAAGELVEVPVYRWCLPDDPAPAERLVQATAAGELDAVTFTSQPAVHHLFRIADGLGMADAVRAAFNSGKSGVLAACVGPVCAEAARDEGIEAPVWPEPPRLPGMVRVVEEHLARR